MLIEVNADNIFFMFGSIFDRGWIKRTGQLIFFSTF
jgi:hypothetical protein